MKPTAILSLVGNMRIFDDFKFGLALLDKAGTSGNHTRTIVQIKTILKRSGRGCILYCREKGLAVERLDW